MKTISISKWVAAVERKAESRKQKAEMKKRGSDLNLFFAFALLALFAPFTGFAQANLNVGTLLPGEKIIVTFNAQINTNFPANTFSVTNRAIATATGVSFNSDDPDTALLTDPTITPLSVAPVITFCPPNVTTNTAAGTCTRQVGFAATAIGGSTAPTITYKLGAATIASPYTFDKGTNVVTVTASNGVAPNATCTFTVIVLDQEPPSITCPANIFTNTAAGQCFATVFYTVTNSDNCPGQVLIQTAGLASGAAFPRGITTNTFLVRDASSNSASCSFNVVVNDTEPPTIICPSNMVLSTDAGQCTRSNVTYTVTPNDNCPGPSVTQTAGLPSGATFPKGITTNRFTVTDMAGNTNTCSFTVTINDTEAPTIICSSNLVFSSDAGRCSRSNVTYTVTPSDNCPGATVSQTAGLASGATFPTGITTNRFRVTDASGNTNTCSFTVTVNDTQPPVISCPGDIITNTLTACGAVVIFNPQPFATDNCGVTNLVVTPASNTLFPIGTNVVKVVATDFSGNTNSCTFKVIVLGSAPSPLLTILQSGTNVVLSWSNSFPCYALQYAPELGQTNLWTNYAGAVTQSGGNFYATNGIGPASLYYRLMR